MRNWSWFSLRTRPRSVRPKTSMSDGAGRGGSAEAAESALMERVCDRDCEVARAPAPLAYHMGPILKGVLTAPVRPEAAACSVYPFPT